MILFLIVREERIVGGGEGEGEGVFCKIVLEIEVEGEKVEFFICLEVEGEKRKVGDLGEVGIGLVGNLIFDLVFFFFIFLNIFCVFLVICFLFIKLFLLNESFFFFFRCLRGLRRSNIIFWFCKYNSCFGSGIFYFLFKFFKFIISL